MISHDYKFIFIHIPKVAGTSIVEALSDTNIKTDYKLFKSTDSSFKTLPPHLAAKHYLSFQLVSESEFSEYFKFAFVRNPFERIVSEYKYRHHPHKYPFKEFVKHHLPRPTWTDNYCHIIPQYDFIYDTDGTKLVDFVGRYENLKDDFNEVCRLINIPQRDIKHKNSSNSIFRRNNNIIELLKNTICKLSINCKRNTFTSCKEYYDAETIRIVENIYSKDLEFFNYSFPG